MHRRIVRRRDSLKPPSDRVVEWAPSSAPLSLGPSSADWLQDKNSLRVGAGSREVRKIFGFPGDGINGVFGALHRTNGKIAFRRGISIMTLAVRASSLHPHQ